MSKRKVQFSDNVESVVIESESIEDNDDNNEDNSEDKIGSEVKFGKKFKHTLDSDEEDDELIEQNYNVLDSDQIDVPGRGPAALPDRAGEHRAGRAVPARFPEDRTEQPHPGHRGPRPGRWRRAAEPVRVRRHPAVPGRQEWPLHPRRPAWPQRGAAVAVLADGRPRPDGRPEPPLRPVRARADPLRDRKSVV